MKRGAVATKGGGPASGLSRPKPRFGFVREVISETKKVTWPTRRETFRLSAMVIVVSVVMGLFLGAVDFGFTNLVDKLLIGGP